jgi:hypothetical protein
MSEHYEKLEEALYEYTCFSCGKPQKTRGRSHPTGWVEVTPSFNDVEPDHEEPFVYESVYLCYNCITPTLRNWIGELRDD